MYASVAHVHHLTHAWIDYHRHHSTYDRSFFNARVVLDIYATMSLIAILCPHQQYGGCVYTVRALNCLSKKFLGSVTSLRVSICHHLKYQCQSHNATPGQMLLHQKTFSSLMHWQTFASKTVLQTWYCDSCTSWGQGISAKSAPHRYELAIDKNYYRPLHDNVTDSIHHLLDPHTPS